MAASVVGAIVALGVIGSNQSPNAADFRFSRGATLDIGQEEAQRSYLADVAADARIDILLTGHTSTDGDPQANINLSRLRAEAAQVLGLDMGVASSRMRVNCAWSRR